MVRKYFNGLKQSDKDKIRWRSHEVSRIEAFSDAVFAFAITLLIISLEVPKSSTELLEMMEGFVPFIFCFGIIFFIWYLQYRFFRQYGLHDRFTLFLNGALLFLVLFYVYPLKFMVSAVLVYGHGAYIINKEDFVPLMLLYNCGFT
ncbi:MAG: DUF1211 domain-containing protein, partial [Bacteroidetes bacterium]|nr:DUF1211 domain-containing protein [Bacteroidota bacterium]